MTVKEAKECLDFVLDSACHNHKWECSCVENGRIKNNIPCSCGATEHNYKVVVSIGLISRMGALPQTDWDVGIESPTWKFDGEA